MKLITLGLFLLTSFGLYASQDINFAAYIEASEKSDLSLLPSRPTDILTDEEITALCRDETKEVLEKLETEFSSEGDAASRSANLQTSFKLLSKLNYRMALARENDFEAALRECGIQQKILRHLVDRLTGRARGF